ncbi:MAG: hypothetical protein ACREKN_08085 [Longimicrobiaceae bacterium]
MTRFLFAAAALAVAAPAAAQEIDSPYRYLEETKALGGYGGYLWTGRGEIGAGPAPAPLAGLRFSVRFAGPAYGDFRLGFSPSERTVYRAAEPGDTTLVKVGTASAPLVIAEAGLRFQVTGPRSWRKLAPYLAASGALAADLGRGDDFEEEVPEDERFDFGPALAVGVAAGTDWYLSERLSLNLELRDYIWRLQVPDGLRAAASEERQWINNLALTVGAALHF